MWTPRRREVIALVALLDLALVAPTDTWVKTQAIAARHDIPLAFLEQITHRLCQVGLLRSRRGPSGGLRLAKAPREVRVGEVLRAVAPREAVAEQRAHTLEALVLEQLTAVGAELSAALDQISLEQLCEGAERLGLVERVKTALSFDI